MKTTTNNFAKTTLKKLSLTLVSLTMAFALMFSPVMASNPATPPTGKVKKALQMEFQSDKYVSPGSSILATVNFPKHGIAKLSVKDMQGKEVWSRDMEMFSGENQIKFKVSELESGFYRLSIGSGDLQSTQSFIVK
ncbi:MAG: T9SS type A sorting domain-containing protein [Bacteroidota bacterium]